MLRRFTNVSGSPEVKIRRQSPVFGGARIYPGSFVEYDDAEWATLDEATKRQLDALCAVDPPIFVREDFPDPKQIRATAKPAPTVVEEPEVIKPEFEGESDEPLEEEAVSEEAVSEEPEVVEPKSEAGETDGAPVDEGKVEVSEGVKEPSEVPDREESEFNYAEFLEQSVKDIKAAFAAAKHPPAVDKLIAAEKAGQNRSSLIGWLKKHSN